PVSGQPVTKVEPFMMLEDEQLNIQPESTMLREGGGVQSIRFTVSPVSLVPISFYLVIDEQSSTWQVDYDVLGGPLAIEPGQSSGEILVDVHADSQFEGIETFGLKSIDYWSEWVTIGIIDAEERPATITPEDVDVFTGDPFSLDVTLPFGVPWIAFAEASSSDPNVASPATPFSRIDAGSLSATIPMRAGDTGDATVTVSLDQGLGISPVTATVHVYGGEITFDTDGLRLGAGESARVDVQLNNPPPAGVSLMVDAANSRVAGADAFLVIAADGTGTMTVTGLAAGATRLQIYSPGGRVVAWLDVEVVKTEVVVTSVTPPVGPPSGGTAVTINGRGFVAPCTVSFGGSSATGIAVVDETTIRATTSARAAGTVAATVTCSGQTGTLANAFTYVAGRGRAVRH
ncbi:MAG TPA: IPT/TIG domain-containing protein, partial [Thermoanaerobaculia bacterium]|nr:IPT/TIG domain-containing protein [Thermoanaerobaculia bacterium]